LRILLADDYIISSFVVKKKFKCKKLLYVRYVTSGCFWFGSYYLIDHLIDWISFLCRVFVFSYLHMIDKLIMSKDKAEVRKNAAQNACLNSMKYFLPKFEFYEIFSSKVWILHNIFFQSLNSMKYFLPKLEFLIIISSESLIS
jgi:hypothetical protein